MAVLLRKQYIEERFPIMKKFGAILMTLCLMQTATSLYEIDA